MPSSEKVGGDAGKIVCLSLQIKIEITCESENLSSWTSVNLACGGSWSNGSKGPVRDSHRELGSFLFFPISLYQLGSLIRPPVKANTTNEGLWWLNCAAWSKARITCNKILKQFWWQQSLQLCFNMANNSWIITRGGTSKGLHSKL